MRPRMPLRRTGRILAGLLLLALPFLAPAVSRAGEGGSSGDPIEFGGYARGVLGPGPAGSAAETQNACRFTALECWFAFWYDGGGRPYTLALTFDLPGERQELDAGFDVFDDRLIQIGSGVMVGGQRSLRVWRFTGDSRQRFFVKVYDKDTDRLR